MKPNQLERLLRLVVRTEDEELSCTACFELLPLYVDLDVSGQAPDVLLPPFERHLEQCAVCREEYETVRELARLEAEGRSPSIDDLRRLL
jgi:predicted anti-sigma-YlaC factor YlaD